MRLAATCGAKAFGLGQHSRLPDRCPGIGEEGIAFVTTAYAHGDHGLHDSEQRHEISHRRGFDRALGGLRLQHHP